MPIYAYRCSSCGHAQDVLQKMSDPLLSVCPACSASTYVKQLTSAGFQLKGSGWYVTDFREGNNGAKKAEPGAETAGEKAPVDAKPDAKPEGKADAPAQSKTADAKTAPATPAAAAPPAKAATPSTSSPPAGG
jgi:putative FmdB family regulatory protein